MPVELIALSLPELWTHFVSALPVILALILIEGLLSIDNALAIAAMASHLEEKQRTLAMNIGYIGAYGFRLIALFFASMIIANQWVMFIGALYLVWLMCAHFASHHKKAQAESLNETVVHRTFAGTITMIALMDLSLSVDNVVAAVALSPKDLWPVYVGVTIGIISLRLVASIAVKMIHKYPVLEHTAFILVGYVGLLLIAELQFADFFHHYSPTQLKLIKFAGILLLTGSTIAWSRLESLRNLLRPLLNVLLLPMFLFATLIDTMLMILTWPVKKLYAQVNRA